MALANKIGSLLKKATNSSPTLYQAIRCMSSSKLFVGGLSYGTDDHSLKDAFANYGQVIEARIIQDRETGRSRGFGFVTYTSSEEAAAAITALDGQDLHGRSIRVNYATERTGGFRSGGFGGYGGGGYGGGGGFGGGGGGRYGGSYGNRGGDFGGSGGGGYGVAGGSRDNDTFSGTNFAGGGGNNFTGSNFGGDSGFSGNPAGNFGAAGGSTGGDDFSSGAPGDNFESGKNDDLMGDLIKDDEPDTYANKRG